jgi:hypothetical protein
VLRAAADVLTGWPPKLAASLEHNVSSTVGRATCIQAAPSWPPRAQRAPKHARKARIHVVSRPGTTLGPRAPDQLYAIVVEHKDSWYSAALPAAPGAPCALKRSSQPSCPKQPRKPRDARNSRGGPRQLRDIVAQCLPDVARARTARGRRPRPLKLACRANKASSISNAARRRVRKN